MIIVAEIADKMPSTLGVLVAAVVAAVVSVGVACTARTAAWAIFGIAVVVGGLYAAAAAFDAFSTGTISDALWRELGWSWVSANVILPLLPAVSVASTIAIRFRLAARRGFPVETFPTAGKPAAVVEPPEKR